MPITVPGISIEAAKRLVQAQDRILKGFPEVERVFGKAGRAETATDPAPLSMIETVILLKPPEQWRAGMTRERLLEEMAAALQMPGLQNAWTMPIKARGHAHDGNRTPIGVKVFGKDLGDIAVVAEDLERILKDVPGTIGLRRAGTQGFFWTSCRIAPQSAGYGLKVMEVLRVETAIGGEDIDTTVEGRERYTINVRYPRELRSSVEKLRGVLVSVPARGGAPAAAAGGMGPGDASADGGMGAAPAAQIPLGQLGQFKATMGPPMIKSEGGLLTGWVYVDITSRDIGGYVKSAKLKVARELKLLPGTYLKWTGQYEFLERIQARMKIVVPLTLLLIFVILYLNFQGLTQALIVLLQCHSPPSARSG
jgi:Cu(I)/Ag(I) efflux system membrane protein CusA/SilA